MLVRIENSKTVYECVATDINNAIDKYIATLGYTTGFTVSAETWATVKVGVTDQNTRIALVNGMCKNESDKISRIISDFTVDYPLLPALSVPELSISTGGTASWSTVANAIGYKYIIQGQESDVVQATSVQLSVDHSIVVKAIGDGLNYSDSEYCAVKTYVAE